jgi:oxygen-independent coproporphyrinogen-3 oxidase
MENRQRRYLGENKTAMNIDPALIKKYNIPVPRYTSYPTVPFWDKVKPSDRQWFDIVKHTFDETNVEQGISIYIHLPFCESLCTYCGCNTRITKNHKVEDDYIKALLMEWKQYMSVFDAKPIIRELHLGGGTPTFFSPENLKYLIEQLLDECEIHPSHEFGFEGHPNNTTKEHLQVLYDVGFRRVSYGIQDLDLKVQQTINRIQPYENVQRATLEAREVGYESVNFDLIYGLPYQTSTTVADTIQQIAKLSPDRIAYYSYAHVPWVKPGQRSYSSKDLPANEEKQQLYELGKSLLTNLGYVDVGMDHFALKTDELYKAMRQGTLHRNFMGYTVSNTSLLIGLGTSAISDAKYAYLQNEKKVEDYKSDIATGNLSILKGHLLMEEDLMIRGVIKELTCKGVANFQHVMQHPQWSQIEDRLQQLEADGLLTMLKSQVRVSSIGKNLIRNIANAFDLKYHEPAIEKKNTFSQAI